MRNKLTKIFIIAGLVFIASVTDARPPVVTADRAKESKFEPVKKKPGEECKSSDECRLHHTCEQTSDKKVCMAPTPVEIPKT